MFCYYAQLCSSQMGELLCSKLCQHNVPRPIDWAFFLSNRTSLMEGRGSLEEQLEAVKRKAGEITAKKESLRVVEERGAQIEEALIFDNK